MSKRLHVERAKELAGATYRKRVCRLHPLLLFRGVGRPYLGPEPSYHQGDLYARLPCPCLLRSVATFFVGDHRSEWFAYVH